MSNYEYEVRLEIEGILIEEVGIETFDFDVPIELVISFSTEFGVELRGYRYKVVNKCEPGQKCEESGHQKLGREGITLTGDTRQRR